MDKVIFDTNAYRYLVKGKTYEKIDKLIQRIKLREDRNNIETLISPIVAKELLAHVADKKDASFDKCLKAIKALYLHNGDDRSYSYLATPEMLIAKYFFGKDLPQKEETNRALIQICYHLSKDPSDKIFKKFSKNLRQNREHVQTTELSFAYGMKEFINRVDPNATGWQIFKDDEQKRTSFLNYIRSDHFSFGIALEFLSVPLAMLIDSGDMQLLPNEEFAKMAKDFVEVFPEPIALQKLVIENIVNSEFNLLEDSRANFIWDTQLMFNIGNHTIADSKLYFVTDDKAMIRTAIANNARYSILTFDEYLEYLEK